jgi:hypothetical protein
MSDTETRSRALNAVDTHEVMATASTGRASLT